MIMVTKNEARQIKEKCPGVRFISSKHHIFMEERADAKKWLRILRNRNIRSWKRAAACVMLLVLLLTACGRRSGLVYSDDAITVTRDGARLCVMDVQTEEAYRFTTHRVKRAQTAEEAARRAVCKTVSDTDTLTIMTVRNELIIVEKDAGKTVCIR